ncbi:MAG: HAMP domain-containing sensor histidine kinase [Desulfobacterales bacterium]|nr:HAMP domain-containing sensor histidine kinase [Desulfobacterales bacterium]
MTVKTRITLFIVGAGLVSSLFFSVVVFYELLEQPFKLLDTVLKEEAYRTTSMILKRQSTSESASLETVDRAMYAYWIEIYEQGINKVLYQSDLAKRVNLPPVKPRSRTIVKAVIPRGQIKPDQNRSQEVTFRVRTVLIELDGRSFVVQIARTIDSLEEEIWELVFGIVAGLIFSTLALIVISRFMAGKILQPIGRMKDLAQDISEKNLGQRIPPGEGRDEFSELARTINRMLDRLQYSFVRQRDFLFDTSHELKTPLTTMRLAVDEICTSDGENMPPFVRDNLLRLNSQVLRMERLVKDLLNLSSLETLTGIDPKPVQITELLSSLAEEYKFLADAQNIKMDIRLPMRLVIQGDGEKLHRAFSNILDNAVKYNVDGGQIELTCDQSAAELTVTVANTGPGVAEAEIPKVFDQFYRVEKSRSIPNGGSGLGLAIVKRIVELHGGVLKFECRQGAWTRVTASLPRRGDTTLP